MSAATLATRAAKQVELLCENKKAILFIKMKSFFLLIRLGEGLTFN